MDKYLETSQTWNKVAKLYQDKFMNLELYNGSYDVLIDQITNKDAKILEIGCGPGNISNYLLRQNSNFNIKGIDVAPNMIELAKRNNPMATFEVMDIRKIDELKDKFDVIICGFILPYLSKKDCSKFIEDAKQLLNLNGLIYLSFVDGDYDKSGFISGSSGDRVYFYYHNLEFLNSQLELNTFVNTKLIKVEYEKGKEETETHTILIAKKTIE